jgi:hypothetical protein
LILVAFFGDRDQTAQEKRFVIGRAYLQHMRQHTLGIIEPSRLYEQRCGIGLRNLLLDGSIASGLRECRKSHSKKS